MTDQTRTLSEEVWKLIRAGFAGIWIETQEPTEAALELTSLGSQRDLRQLVWNLDSGLRGIGSDAGVEEVADPLTAVRSLGAVQSDRPTLLLLENFHRFVDSPEICQAVSTQLQIGKQLGRHIIVLSPLANLPIELERQFAVVSHKLPTREQLGKIASSLIEDNDMEGQPFSCEQVLDAAVGFTRLEAESAFCLSLVRHGKISDEEIWELKSRWLEKSGLLRLYRGKCGFETLGGLSNLKEFCGKSLGRQRRSMDSTAKPRGVMLLGVPGTGKSAFAKALGKEVGRPVLMLDMGQLMGALVGQSEANIRAALQAADAMAPCILFIDEVEKALSGIAAGGRSDSGVSNRLFGTLLTWLNDHESEVYVVVTCNNIQQLPPEFSRAERFDAIMFLDLPREEEKRAIWSMYLAEFRLDCSQGLPDDAAWTGAEVKACCRLACLLGIPLQEAAQFIVPVGVTAAEDIESLRSWASGRCLDASRRGIYRKTDARAKRDKSLSRSKRGVSLRPSAN